MNKLREIRKAKGMALKDVADRANTSVQQIQRLERGERRLTVDWIKRLADALNVEPSEIVPDIAYNGEHEEWEQQQLQRLRELDDAGRQAFENMLKSWPKGGTND